MAKDPIKESIIVFKTMPEDTQEDMIENICIPLENTIYLFGRQSAIHLIHALSKFLNEKDPHNTCCTIYRNRKKAGLLGTKKEI